MNKLLGASWKTSLLGLISGIAILVQSYLEKGETDIPKIVIAIGVFLLGRFASDYKK